MSGIQNIVSIYGVYVQTITANEQRRQALSAFYLSLVAVGIALLASEKEIEYLAIAVPISIVSLVWFSTIQYFRNLAKAKFKVIFELEDCFEIKPFSQEWIYYKQEKGKYKMGLTHLELIIPSVLFIASSAFIVYRIIAPLVC